MIQFPAYIVYHAPEVWENRQAGLLENLEVVNGSALRDIAIDECSICLGPFSIPKPTSSDTNDEPPLSTGNDAVKLTCDHIYHRDCLKLVVEKHKPVCCVCRKPIRLPQGTCPTGYMSIAIHENRPCPGFTHADGSSVDAIVIRYTVPSGVQKEYHYHPGEKFKGTQREAYLPNNQEGRDLLARLVFAWKHGLIFTVGTSMTTHKPNQVVWASIHHKTSLNGGPHIYGFPDPGYLLNCHESLDALYVPDAKSCWTMENLLS
ncbi:hypothetical protein ACA910_002599 [Epithemia clementina (nom. ined.)]